MKAFASFLILCMLLGCVKDVSHLPPHDKLVGSVWKLKMDAYITEYLDQRGVFYITPCAEYFRNSNPFIDGSGKYYEAHIGREYGVKRVVGGLRAGEALKVVRIVKVPNIEMGTIYHPKMIPERINKWTGGKEVDGENLYYGRDKNGKFFDEQGILNPEYAEIVSVVTNPPPQCAEGGGGSESSHP